MNWYFKLLANRPWLILIAIAVFCLACILVSITVKTLPDFSDPTSGFEARGTEIGKRMTAWLNLIDETRPSGILIANPNEMQQEDFFKKRKENNSKKKNKKTKKSKNRIKVVRDELLLNGSGLLEVDGFDESNVKDTNNRHWNYGKNLSFTSEEEYNKKIEQRTKEWKLLREQNPPRTEPGMHVRTNGFFCGAPNVEYAHFVVQRVNYNLTESMFELNALLAICDLEYQLQQIEPYRELCETEITSSNCCRPWSLPNYVAVISNKTSCFDIEEEDVQQAKNLIQKCYTYYETMKLSNDCDKRKCHVPPDCARKNAVYNILHYLIDSASVQENATEVFVVASMIFAPFAKSTKALPFYYNLKKRSLSNTLVSVNAMDMGLKNVVFEDCLRFDGWLMALGLAFVLACIWLYTKSLFLAMMTMCAIVFSLGLAYFIYAMVFKMSFFPFMNLLAVVVIVGIGADDVFIYVTIWNSTIAERTRLKSLNAAVASTTSISSDSSCSESLSGLIATALKHSALSMFVTSLTTSVAFYTNLLNSITAVRCFGTFAGTVVLCNYVLMITWIPASVSFVERLTCCSQEFCNKSADKFFSFIQKVTSYIRLSVISSVLRMPYLWIVLFGTLGIASGVVIFYWPKIQLPDSPDFKLFSDDHPFEIYDSQFKNMFWFEKSYTNSDTLRLYIRVVWGVIPVDNGNYFDPSSRGTLQLDNDFNLSSIESQYWLLNFCKQFKQQPFYQPSSVSTILPNCFIENFIRTMERRCLDEMSGIDRTPCCETSTFPYSPHVFDECLPQIMSSLYESPRYIFIPGIAGPKFGRNSTFHSTLTNKTTPLVKALVVEYESSHPYTLSYTAVNEFVSTVETWLKEVMKTAPSGMQHAFFISDLQFFDLQQTLSKDTLVAITIAMVVSFLVILMVTFNFLLSLYAIVTVTFTIFSIVAVLVLMNWKLNVLECISICSAIGLSIDFSLIYSVHYRMANESDRKASTRSSLSQMIGPTLMVALTTASAGAFMLLSNVLAYIQLGKFLIIVMSISWTYATFFLMSILRVCGPQYECGQFKYPSFSRGDKQNGKNHLNRNSRMSTQGFATEQLLSASSSAAGKLVGSESHELSSLTSNSIVKPATSLETRPINFDRAFKGKASMKENSPTSTLTVDGDLDDVALTY
ncbi:Protein dispatched [Pseudolycoriella hygida]|uniref:Protein dispatched n=1 Tax=Pseudolycoriella hygida TaxID=35572 RepID=A0A9Q0MUJ6_9DIPT|nr:Protein dispatched [Pseudolycoriella hygida]